MHHFVILIFIEFTGLKLIVKLCGDQGLRETEKWASELQRVQRQHTTSNLNSSINQ